MAQRKHTKTKTQECKEKEQERLHREEILTFFHKQADSLGVA